MSSIFRTMALEMQLLLGRLRARSFQLELCHAGAPIIASSTTSILQVALEVRIALTGTFVRHAARLVMLVIIARTPRSRNESRPPLLRTTLLVPNQERQGT